MKNSNNNNNNETKKSTKKTQEVFGFKISPVWAKELSLIIETVNEYSGQKVATSELIRTAIEKRTGAKFGLKKADELAKGTYRNFVNRLTRFVGGGEASAYFRPSAQSKFFNVFVQAGIELKFEDASGNRVAIDPTANISPQVKGLIVDLSNVKIERKTKRQFKNPTKRALSELAKFGFEQPTDEPTEN